MDESVSLFLHCMYKGFMEQIEVIKYYFTFCLGYNLFCVMLMKNDAMICLRKLRFCASLRIFWFTLALTHTQCGQFVCGYPAYCGYLCKKRKKRKRKSFYTKQVVVCTIVMSILFFSVLLTFASFSLTVFWIVVCVLIMHVKCVCVCDGENS